MRVRGLIPILALALSVGPPARATNPMIEIGLDVPWLGIPELISPVMGALGEIFRQIQALSGFEPSQGGAGEPGAFERTADVLAERLGDSRFSITVEGVGNLRFAGARYFYNEVQGGVGVQYDFLDPTDESAKIALRLSPVHGELAWIRVRQGETPDPTQPMVALLGPALGLDAWKAWGPYRAGLEVRLRAETEISGTGATGMSTYGAVYFRARLDELFPALRGDGKLWIGARLSVADRGDAQGAIYGWPGLEGGDRLRTSWQGIITLGRKF
jgi:hypothetical protein